MIDCTCGQTFLNTDEHESHAISRVVLHGDSADSHRVDWNGPTVITN